ncbi:hypothetical protein ACRASX_10940 [Flavobacterium sp. TMP13]|uniref:hypothetical protein n=1 Tax=Flavobacterium sp. TMP13 TaxID=3425950 RepID=UPI003D77BC0B
MTDAELIQGNYNELIAGIAPSGAVVLWISGVNDTKEIEIYKADEISPDLIKEYDIVEKDQRTKVLNDTCICEDRPQFRKTVNNCKAILFGIWTNKYYQKFN